MPRSRRKPDCRRTRGGCRCGAQRSPSSTVASPRAWSSAPRSRPREPSRRPQRGHHRPARAPAHDHHRALRRDRPGGARGRAPGDPARATRTGMARVPPYVLLAARRTRRTGRVAAPPRRRSRRRARKPPARRQLAGLHGLGDTRMRTAARPAARPCPAPAADAVRRPHSRLGARSVPRRLGFPTCFARLAVLCGDIRAAERHFEHAAERDEVAGAPVWVRRDLADMPSCSTRWASTPGRANCSTARP